MTVQVSTKWQITSLIQWYYKTTAKHPLKYVFKHQKRGRKSFSHKVIHGICFQTPCSTTNTWQKSYKTGPQFSIVWLLLQELSWISDVTGQCRCCCCVRRCQIYLPLLVTHTAWEVPICCRYTDLMI